MENKKQQQSKTPASSQKTQQQPQKNGQQPFNKNAPQQKKPGSNW